MEDFHDNEGGGCGLSDTGKGPWGIEAALDAGEGAVWGVKGCAVQVRNALGASCGGLLVETVSSAAVMLCFVIIRYPTDAIRNA